MTRKPVKDQERESECVIVSELDLVVLVTRTRQANEFSKQKRIEGRIRHMVRACRKRGTVSTALVNKHNILF